MPCCAGSGGRNAGAGWSKGLCFGTRCTRQRGMRRVEVVSQAACSRRARGRQQQSMRLAVAAGRVACISSRGTVLRLHPPPPPPPPPACPHLVPIEPRVVVTTICWRCSLHIHRQGAAECEQSACWSEGHRLHRRHYTTHRSRCGAAAAALGSSAGAGGGAGQLQEPSPRGWDVQVQLAQGRSDMGFAQVWELWHQKPHRLLQLLLVHSAAGAAQTAATCGAPGLVCKASYPLRSCRGRVA